MKSQAPQPHQLPPYPPNAETLTSEFSSLQLGSGQKPSPSGSLGMGLQVSRVLPTSYGNGLQSPQEDYLIRLLTEREKLADARSEATHNGRQSLSSRKGKHLEELSYDADIDTERSDNEYPRPKSDKTAAKLNSLNADLTAEFTIPPRNSNIDQSSFYSGHPAIQSNSMGALEYHTSLIKAFDENDSTRALELVRAMPPAALRIKDSNHHTPLYRAIRKGYNKVILEIAKKGGCINTKSVDGTPPLISAIKRGNSPAALALIKYGADIQAKDKHNQSAIWWAEKKEMTDVVLKIAIQKNEIYASNTPLYISGPFLLPDLTKSHQQISLGISNGTPPLISAIKNGNLRDSLALIEQGASVSLRDGENRSALWWATEKRFFGIGRKLVSRMSNADLRKPDQNAETPLTFAISQWDNDTAKAIIARLPREDLLAPNGKGETPLVLAEQHKQSDVVAALLKAGVRLNQPQTLGNLDKKI